MHQEVLSFLTEVKRTYPYKFRNKQVLEVGSQDINGSPRKFFWGWKGTYTGLDIMPGKGVDVVSALSLFNPGHTYDTVISCEMLEHSVTWKYDLRRMYELLSPKGLLIVTCAGPHRREHGTKLTTPEASPATTNYYRNISTSDFEEVLPVGYFDPYVLKYSRGKNDLQFYGIKWHPTSTQIYHSLMNKK